MIKVKGFVAGSVLGAAMLASGPALAATGFVSAVSEYTFRGIDSENGAAVQGELDWSSGGAYLGSWASNSSVVGGTELDVYGGYKFTLTDISNIDVGVIYYYFSEEDEANLSASYPEVYIGLNYGGFSGKAYYADKFFDELSDVPGSDQRSIYVNLAYTYAISDTLSLKGAIGNQSGDGVEAAYAINSSITDYAVTLTKTLDAGFAASFAVVGTDGDNVDFSGRKDKPKVVLGLTKNFEL